MERAGHRRDANLDRTTADARGSGGTVFFLDEIHRFNKAQQDALLPAVEEGLVILIGATTENPYFEGNSALLSRSQVYELEPLTKEQEAGLAVRAPTQPQRVVGPRPPAGASGGRCRSPGGRARRNARMRAQPQPGRRLPRARA